jgi:hypothetical protein
MAKMTIKRIGVFSLAKLQGVILAVLGLVVGIPLGLIMIIFGAAMMTQGGEAAAGGGVGLGLGLFYMIMLPVMYGVMGFVFGAITALVYNVASGFIGGLEFEMESAATEYGAPPPPPQWSANTYQSGQQQY